MWRVGHGALLPVGYVGVDVCISRLNGHLEVLQWALELGCLWDPLTSAYAARAGHRDVLRWAREHG